MEKEPDTGSFCNEGYKYNVYIDFLAGKGNSV